MNHKEALLGMKVTGKVESIQACRFLAAAMILWVHFHYVVGLQTSDLWWIHTGVGAFGVDLFFVISGFVMIICTKDRNLTKLEFLKSRFIRIFPLYIVFSTPYIVKDLANKFDFVKLFDTLLLIPVFDVGSYVGTSHPFGWTIAFEIWFYILFSITLLNRKEKYSLMICVVLAFFTLIAGMMYEREWFLPRFLTCPLLLEFLCGCIIANVYKKISIKFGLILLVIAILLYFGVATYHGELAHCGVIESHFQSLLRFVFWGVPAVLFCLALVSLEHKGSLKTPKILSSLGGASFSMYLAQPYFVFICKKYFVYENIYLTFIGYFAVSIGGASIVSRFVEYPLLQAVRKIFATKQKEVSIIKAR